MTSWAAVWVTMVTSREDGEAIRVLVRVTDERGETRYGFVDVDRKDPTRIVASSKAWGPEGPPAAVVTEATKQAREHLSGFSTTAPRG